MIWLRSAAFNAWFFTISFALALATLPLRALPRFDALAYARFWARLMLGGLRVICGIRYQVTGIEHLPRSGPALLACMHQSAFDTLVWMLLLDRPAYVLKQELMRIPLFGAMFRLTGMIAVDRRNGAAGLRQLLRGGARAVAAGQQMVIFPEGTRVAPGVRVKLQPGVAALAATTGLKVIPVLTDSGRFWGRRAFRKRPGVIRIAIQPPLDPALTRSALLASLQEAFTHPVDNSVGGQVSGFSSHASSISQ